MLIYYAMNIGLNIGSIFIAQYFNFSSTQSNWIVIVAIISMIVHYIVLRGYKKLAFEEVTKDSINELGSRTTRLESLRWFSNFVAPIMCLIFLR